MKEQKHLVKALRILSGLSQRDLADLLAVDQSTISRLENQRRNLTPEERSILAEFFKIDSKALEIQSKREGIEVVGKSSDSN